MIVALALVVVFTFAVASSAYAAWGDNTYGTTWTGTPHTLYTTTSTKCSVCHAVHGAKAVGEKLLQSLAADSCTYCHITSGLYTTVYDGNATLYTTASNQGHNYLGATAAATSVGCTDCHTVHGGGTVTIAAVSRNLRALTAENQFQTIASRTTYPDAWSVEGAALNSVTEWCSGCHPYLNTAVSDAAAGTADNMSHAMKAATSTYPVGGTPMAVAWAKSSLCEDCHDATADGNAAAGQGVAFPHYTTAERFLMSADDTGTAKTAATDPMQDGVCLKCHRNATQGVGRNF